jgi:hypothetical protein
MFRLATDPSQGSPYGTGEANQVSPQWKRLASIQGDLVFQATRRCLLKELSARQNAWSYRTLPLITDPLRPPTGDSNFLIVSRQFEGFPDLGTVSLHDPYISQPKNKEFQPNNLRVHLASQQ